MTLDTGPAKIFWPANSTAAKWQAKLFSFDYITDKINQNALTPDLELFDSTDIDIILLTTKRPGLILQSAGMSDSYTGRGHKGMGDGLLPAAVPLPRRFGY
ncbi:MAG: hypothetical protein ACE37N_10120 [Pseudohongiellaceae bacterium]